MIVRPEQASDAEAIEQVHRAAFGRDVEALMPQQMRTLPEFIPELSLVAEIDTEVVGHVLLSVMHHESLNWEGKLLALGPIGVVPERQRTGIGTKLMGVAIERARGLGYQGIVLIGHPTYYPRFGFKPASTWRIELPNDVPDDVAMALELTPGSLRGAAGRVSYSEAFPT